MPKPLQFDMVFLDHLKPLYTVDLKVMEEEGLIGPVSIVQLSILAPLPSRPPLGECLSCMSLARHVSLHSHTPIPLNDADIREQR